MAGTYTEKRFSNYREIVNFAAATFPENKAFTIKLEEGKYRTVYYKELKDLYYRLCTHMIEKGLMGKRIAVVGHNCFEWAISYLCAATVGVVVPIDKELPFEDILNIVNSSDSEVLFYSGKYENDIIANASKFKNVKYFIGFDRDFENKNFLFFHPKHKKRV